MKKAKIYLSVLAVFAVIIVILLHNRTSIKAAENVEKIDVYPVNVDTVRAEFLSDKLNLVGIIHGYNDVPIVAEAQGKVVKVSAEVGDFKKAGSTLIQLDDVLEQAAFKTAEVNYTKTQKDYNRYQALYNEKSATDAQLEGAKLALQSAQAQYISTKKAYEDTKITTPITGVVTSRNFNIGDFVSNHAVVAEVVDIANLKVRLNVSELDVFNLKVGDKVKITTDVYPGVTFEGKIRTISDKGDAAHTYPVEVDFSNSSVHPLKDGMFAHVIFNARSHKKELVIPRDALLGSIKDAQVFVVENGKAQLKNPVIGKTSNNYLEVLSGLKEGDIVIVNGQNNLKENYKVKIVR